MYDKFDAVLDLLILKTAIVINILFLLVIIRDVRRIKAMIIELESWSI